MRQDFKVDGDYAIVSSSLYSKFPTLNGDNDDGKENLSIIKPDQPPPPKPPLNAYIVDKPPIDRKNNKWKPTLYSEVIKNKNED